jgi:hypothetical protein
MPEIEMRFSKNSTQNPNETKLVNNMSERNKKESIIPTHLKFKEIYMDGNIKDFSNKLIEIGFKHEVSYHNNIILKGVFCNKDCKLWLRGTKDNNLIYQVYVTFPIIKDFFNRKTEYLELTKELNEKYGNGKLCFYPKILTDSKYNTLGTDFTTWSLNSGNIYLGKEDKHNTISYVDSINHKLYC